MNTGNTKRFAAGIVGLTLLAIFTISFVSAYANTISPNGAIGGGGATSPVPTISVPTATSTTGNVMTKATGSSPTTHDMVVCAIAQNVSNTVGSWSTAGWFGVESSYPGYDTNQWLTVAGHCIQSDEPATTTFTGFNANAGTVQCCALLRNTGCTQDLSAAVQSNLSSTNVAWPAITTTINKEMLIFGAAWNPASGTVSITPPAGVTQDVTIAGVAAANTGCFIGHEFLATAGTFASVTGTLNTASKSGTAIGAIRPVNP